MFSVRRGQRKKEAHVLLIPLITHTVRDTLCTSFEGMVYKQTAQGIPLTVAYNLNWGRLPEETFLGESRANASRGVQRFPREMVGKKRGGGCGRLL